MREGSEIVQTFISTIEGFAEKLYWITPQKVRITDIVEIFIITFLFLFCYILNLIYIFFLNLI